jgi:hypothetical protein
LSELCRETFTDVIAAAKADSDPPTATIIITDQQHSALLLHNTCNEDIAMGNDSGGHSHTLSQQGKQANSDRFHHLFEGLDETI